MLVSFLCLLSYYFGVMLNFFIGNFLLVRQLEVPLDILDPLMMFKGRLIGYNGSNPESDEFHI